MPYTLSLVIPFYNAVEKSKPLFQTLENINDDTLELVLVDDGSTDGTLAMLQEFAERTPLVSTVISQENKGPGGARNAGLKAARGEYVWFVDADDDIKYEAITLVKKLADKEYDFIDFDIETTNKARIPMKVFPGAHNDPVEVKKSLIEHYGLFLTKCYRRKTLIENKLFYPEYCYYEDNPLAFIHPFYFKSYYKSDILGYIYIEDQHSISRSPINARYFDRLWTAEWGFQKALQLTTDKEEIDTLHEKFTRIYLFLTVGRMIGRWPNPNWLLVLRVMRQFRDVNKKYAVGKNPLSYLKASTKYKSKFYLLWFLSHLLPSQEKFFKSLRLKAWGREFDIQ